MGEVYAGPNYSGIVRWTARVWTVLVTALVALIIVTPDPYATEPVRAEDWFFLSLWGFALMGLWVAWRWELGGAIITIATMIFRELAWIFLKGDWMASFLIVWLLLVIPAVLFVLAWELERRREQALS